MTHFSPARVERMIRQGCFFHTQKTYIRSKQLGKMWYPYSFAFVFTKQKYRSKSVMGNCGNREKQSSKSVLFDDLHKFMWVDVKDKENKWLEAQIIHMKLEKPRRVRVHFRGCVLLFLSILFVCLHAYSSPKTNRLDVLCVSSVGNRDGMRTSWKSK
jgi:hypothetical protein